MTNAELRCDVVVVGGGLVGSVAVDALDALPLETVVIESQSRTAREESGFDARSTALANGSQRILETLGLWDRVRYDAEAIRTIHISERGRFGAARISAEEEGVPALGYTVENRLLHRAFWEPLERGERSTVLAPASLATFSVDADRVTAEVDVEGGGTVTVGARLLIAADGARSGVRRHLGIGTREDDYRHEAVIFNCATRALEGRAYERFTEHGPLALLPLSRGRGAVVWTQPAQRAEAFMQRDDDGVREALQATFGRRLGRFGRIGRRFRYPLARVRSTSTTADRAVLIGNAAVSLHPVAGQGFNLALRDVATLAEVIADALTEPGADIGAAPVLERYRDWRRRDQRNVAAFTHGLIRLFEIGWPGAGSLRGAGLIAFDLFPGAKAMLASHTMGRAGRLPRLARGLTLGG